MTLYVNFRFGRTVCLRSVAAIVLLALSFGASEETAAQWRSVDGSGNNLANPDWGAVATPLEHQATADYPGAGSGTTILEPPARANPQDISNAIFDQGATSVLSSRGLTSGLWQWGQFLAHDIDLTGTDAANGTADISVDAGDILAPGPISFTRSNFETGTGTSSANPRR